jgi:hypothetical protein
MLSFRLLVVTIEAQSTDKLPASTMEKLNLQGCTKNIGKAHEFKKVKMHNTQLSVAFFACGVVF